MNIEEGKLVSGDIMSEHQKVAHKIIKRWRKMCSQGN